MKCFPNIIFSLASIIYKNLCYNIFATSSSNRNDLHARADLRARQDISLASFGLRCGFLGSKSIRVRLGFIGKAGGVRAHMRIGWSARLLLGRLVFMLLLFSRHPHEPVFADVPERFFVSRSRLGPKHILTACSALPLVLHSAISRASKNEDSRWAPLFLHFSEGLSRFRPG